MVERFEIPVVLFVFKRLETVEKIMDQISRIKPTTFYIFADGARESVEGEDEMVKEVQEYVKKAIDWECDSRLSFSEVNKGCDRNIRDGLDKVFSEQDMAIVFEDDAVPVSDFFYYCKELLNEYKEDTRIQYIAGFNAIGSNDLIKDDYTFGKTVPMSGAFATWADRWNHCDFELKKWPQNKKSDRFKNIFFSNEFKKICYKEFDEIYDGVVTAWDLMVMHDMFDKDRVAIVPKNNLATSYGFMAGAFHPQEKHEAARLLKIMTATDIQLEFPLSSPSEVKDNREYNYLRQKMMLAVRGSYVSRRIRNIKRAVKDFAYKHLPRSIWNAIKSIVKPR